MVNGWSTGGQQDEKDVVNGVVHSLAVDNVRAASCGEGVAAHIAHGCERGEPLRTHLLKADQHAQAKVGDLGHTGVAGACG